MCLAGLHVDALATAKLLSSAARIFGFDFFDLLLAGRLFRRSIGLL